MTPMRGHKSYDELVRELQETMRRHYEAGLSAQLECEPAAALPGAVITFRARIFARPADLHALAPEIRCEELPDMSVSMRAKRGPRIDFADFSVRFPTSDLRPERVYHFLLHPIAAGEAIARCTLHMVSKRGVGAAREAPTIVFGEAVTPVARPRKRRR